MSKGRKYVSNAETTTTNVWLHLRILSAIRYYLWNEFHEHFLKDFSRVHTEEESCNRALWDVESTLKLHGLTFEAVGLPVPIQPVDQVENLDDAVAEAVEERITPNGLGCMGRSSYGSQSCTCCIGPLGQRSNEE